jgi:hypothetical protein
LDRNEPDLSAPCITFNSWLDHFTLQSGAFQNAFADLSADVASGQLACPVASCVSFVPLVYASAFASSAFSCVSTSSTGASPYASTFPGDYYPYFGQITVQHEHAQFPVSSAPGVLSVRRSGAVQNLNVRPSPAMLGCVRGWGLETDVS